MEDFARFKAGIRTVDDVIVIKSPIVKTYYPLMKLFASGRAEG